MKRKVVQHGPSTLTVSLPSEWVKKHGLRKGDEITIEQNEHLLNISANGARYKGGKVVSLKALNDELIYKTLSALYKAGYDNVTLEYDGADDLQRIHRWLDTRFIGFEVVEESKNTVHIKRVSDAIEEDVQVLFRRLFHFMLSIADDGLEAARSHDENAYKTIVLRDSHVDKITNFCISVVHKYGQSKYHSDTALYHLIEQLEKLGDIYKDLNVHVAESEPLTKHVLDLYARANNLLRAFTVLFFNFSMERANEFIEEYQDFREEAKIVEETREHPRTVHLIKTIARDLNNLISTTIILHL